jgi:hypothetical protein
MRGEGGDTAGGDGSLQVVELVILHWVELLELLL